MARLLFCCVALIGLSLPARAGELDQEAARAAPATPTAKTSALDGKPVAGTEMDKEAPQQSRRYGGWGWGHYGHGHGYGYGGYRSYRGYGFGYGGYRSFYGYGFGYGYRPYYGYGFGYVGYPSYAYYAPYCVGYGSVYYGGW